MSTDLEAGMLWLDHVHMSEWMEYFDNMDSRHTRPFDLQGAYMITLFRDRASIHTRRSQVQ